MRPANYTGGVSVFALLRSLGRPLTVLAAVLVVVGTVLPFSPAGAGAFCVPGGSGFSATHCDACLPVAVAPDAPALPLALALPRQIEAAEPVAAVRTARRERVWIRGPPSA